MAKELNAENEKELVALIEEKGNITVFGEFNQRLRIDNGILVEEWREGTKLHVTTYSR